MFKYQKIVFRIQIYREQILTVSELIIHKPVSVSGIYLVYVFREGIVKYLQYMFKIYFCYFSKCI